MRLFASFVIVAAEGLVSCRSSSGLNGDAAIARSDARGTSIDGGGDAVPRIEASPGPDAGGGLKRVFAPSLRYPQLPPCDANGACPEGQTCFHLAAELAVCDIAQRLVQTACPNTGVDKCACGGLTCAAGLSCAAVPYDFHFQNDCLETPCTSPEDCAGGSVCTPTSLILGSGATTSPPVGRCFTPLCTSDAACTGGVDGRCAVVMTVPGPAGTAHLDKIGCVFAGKAADATACPPGQATDLDDMDGSSTARYHTCAGR